MTSVQKISSGHHLSGHFLSPHTHRVDYISTLQTELCESDVIYLYVWSVSGVFYISECISSESTATKISSLIVCVL